jgi:hypothetical protein
MLLRPAYLSQTLDRPLPTKDGGTLRTAAEARAYMLGLSKARELRSVASTTTTLRAFLKGGCSRLIFMRASSPHHGCD